MRGAGSCNARIRRNQKASTWCDTSAGVIGEWQCSIIVAPLAASLLEATSGATITGIPIHSLRRLGAICIVREYLMKVTASWSRNGENLAPSPWR